MVKTFRRFDSEFICFKINGFLESDHPRAYAKVWFDPVQEYVYVIKNELEKDLFPFKDCVIYQQKELEYCKEMMEQIPQDVAHEQIRTLHFLIKNFEGTMERSYHIDPDPSRSHTHDSRFWKRLYDYAHRVAQNKDFPNAVKVLREKSYQIVYNPQKRSMEFKAPDHIEGYEAKVVQDLHIRPFDTELKEALNLIKDVSTDA